jgi:hypothetical protein
VRALTRLEFSPQSPNRCPRLQTPTPIPHAPERPRPPTPAYARPRRHPCPHRYVGDIVVSVNPFKNVGAVGKNIRNRYKKGGAQNAQLLMPHVYFLVDQTYAQMLTEQKSQSILISGESGAGKTEAMKIALTYIGEVSVK